MRHSLLTVLSLAVTGVLTGCRSLTAIWEHATDLTAADLEVLGLQAGQALPSESTIRRVLQGLDPADVDAHLEDRHQLHTGNGPESMATLRNLATRPHPPGPRRRHLHRLNYQIPVTTTHASHQATHPTNHLNQLCRPLALSLMRLRVERK